MEPLGAAVLLVGLALASVGVWRDVTTSQEQDPGGGLRGVLRPATAGGFRRGLPFYAAAAVAIGLAAFVL